jgi:hypothetical protein
MAPYNTGQFLMDDRLSRDQEAAMGSDTEACAGRRRHRTASDTRTADQLSGDEATNSGNSDSLEREFDIEMDASRSETLCEMSKEQLVTMCLVRLRARTHTRFFLLFFAAIGNKTRTAIGRAGTDAPRYRATDTRQRRSASGANTDDKGGA